MNFFTRSSHGSIPFLSSTDVPQVWGKPRPNQNAPMYNKKFCLLCCVPKKRLNTVKSLNENDSKKYFEKLLKSAPDSAVSVHYLRKRNNNRNHPALIEVDDNQLKIDVELLLCTSEYIIELEMFNLSSENLEFYRNYIYVTTETAVEIAIMTKSQNCDLWITERNKRITASRAYSLFTYASNKNKNWDVKIKNYLTKKNVTTAAMKHGILMEPVAFERYRVQTGSNIQKIGLIVNPEYPWLGCSPDGIDIDNMKIIEIKSPAKGKTDNMQDVLKSLSYLTFSHDKYTIKKKHAYFCQIQLNIFLSNCSSCDLVIANHDQITILNVVRDDEFLTKCLHVLNSIYFNYMLPKLVELNKSN